MPPYDIGIGYLEYQRRGASRLEILRGALPLQVIDPDGYDALLGAAAGDASAVDADLTAHVEDTENPHEVTAAQVGAAPASHPGNTSNPHSVTATQVGARPYESLARRMMLC
jgi:hypothetical protein